jgi:hypothetical protein
MSEITKGKPEIPNVWLGEDGGTEWIKQANYRIKCCKAKTPDGWGELHSLENFLCGASRRINELTDLKMIYEEDKEHSTWKDKDFLDLLDELKELLDIRKRAEELFKLRGW